MTQFWLQIPEITVVALISHTIAQNFDEEIQSFYPTSSAQLPFKSRQL
jgi:hypothetical protein